MALKSVGAAMIHSICPCNWFLLLIVPICQACDAGVDAGIIPEDRVIVTNYLPAPFVTDGSVSYMQEIQTVLKKVSGEGKTVIFPPMKYLIDHENGLEVYSDTRLEMTGAVFLADRGMKRDGQVFYGYNVTNVYFKGGEIIGAREVWDAGTNITGIHLLGACSNVTIQNMSFRNLSSNGIRIYSFHENARSSGIFVQGGRFQACSNIYNDYLEPNAGPVPGTIREDQGAIALYRVKDFHIDGCIIMESLADGIVIYKSSYGWLSSTEIHRSRMGGVLLESCANVVLQSISVVENGSRGITIERGSNRCIIRDSRVNLNGREGIWLDDASECLITGNDILQNGRRNDSILDCNINITDSAWPYDTDSPRSYDNIILGNILQGTSSQWHSIRVSSAAIDIRIFANEMQGEKRSIKADSWLSGVGRVFIENNRGWKTENHGVVTLNINSANSTYSFEHGLDFSDPDSPKMLNHVNVAHSVSPTIPLQLPTYEVVADTRRLTLKFLSTPSDTLGQVSFSWSAMVRYP